MPGILDVASQTAVGGANSIAIIEASVGEQFAVEIRTLLAGTAADLTDWTVTAPLSLRTATVSAAGRVTDLTAASGTDSFVADFVADRTAGRFQVGIDTSLFSNPEPEGGSRVAVPAAVVTPTISDPATNATLTCRLVILARHGTGSPPATNVLLPVDSPTFRFTWDLGGDGDFAVVTQSQLDELAARVAALESA